MRKGAQSFAGFATFAVPAILLFTLVSGSGAGLLAFAGLFLVLQYTNQLDKRDIRRERGSRKR